jgi:TonB family protein
VSDLFERDDLPAGVPTRVLRAWHVAAIVSLALHLAIGAVAIGVAASRPGSTVELPSQRTYPLPDPDAPFVVELPAMANVDAPPTAEAAQVPSPAVVEAGGAKFAHVDGEHAGHGGDVTVTEKARNLAPRPEESTTVDTYRDAIDDEQENRLHSGKHRSSQVDARYALQPMELTFVASGKGFRFERHPVAKVDAALGVAGGKGMPAGVYAIGQGVPLPGDGASKTNGGSAIGSVSSPKGGAAYGQPSIGTPSLIGANVAKARPHVGKGKPAVTADDKAIASDNVDSDQAVAVALKSVVSNSTSGAAALGEGKGGTGGGGEAGAGATSGSGSQSMALGNGNGDAEGPHAIERTTWFRDLQKRLGPIVRDTFPKELEMELRNGTVIVDLIIAKTGGVIDVIVVRPSGVAVFDQNVVTRIRGAGSLEPVPDLLSKGSITVRVPVQGGWRLQ